MYLDGVALRQQRDQQLHSTALVLWEPLLHLSLGQLPTFSSASMHVAHLYVGHSKAPGCARDVLRLLGSFEQSSVGSEVAGVT